MQRSLVEINWNREKITLKTHQISKFSGIGMVSKSQIEFLAARRNQNFAETWNYCVSPVSGFVSVQKFPISEFIELTEENPNIIIKGVYEKDEKRKRCITFS